MIFNINKKEILEEVNIARNIGSAVKKIGTATKHGLQYGKQGYNIYKKISNKPKEILVDGYKKAYDVAKEGAHNFKEGFKEG